MEEILQMPNVIGHALVSTELLCDHSVQDGQDVRSGLGTERIFECVPHRNWITKLVHDVVHNVISKHTH
jgi:hypothetical protein